MKAKYFIIYPYEFNYNHETFYIKSLTKHIYYFTNKHKGISFSNIAKLVVYKLFVFNSELVSNWIMGIFQRVSDDLLSFWAMKVTVIFDLILKLNFQLSFSLSCLSGNLLQLPMILQANFAQILLIIVADNFTDIILINTFTKNICILKK